MRQRLLMLQRGQLSSPLPSTCESGQLYSRKLLLEAVNREVDNVQVGRIQCERVWILCLHKWSPAGRRPFLWRTEGYEERIVFEQEVGLPDFTFSLIKTRILSPLHCIHFSRGTKTKSLVGSTLSVLDHSSSGSTFAKNHRNTTLEQLSSLQREKENQGGKRKYWTGGISSGANLIFRQCRHFLK